MHRTGLAHGRTGMRRPYNAWYEWSIVVSLALCLWCGTVMNIQTRRCHPMMTIRICGLSPTLAVQSQICT